MPKTRCPDCLKDPGFYNGLEERDICRTCDGSAEIDVPGTKEVPHIVTEATESVFEPKTQWSARAGLRNMAGMPLAPRPTLTYEQRVELYAPTKAPFELRFGSAGSAQYPLSDAIALFLVYFPDARRHVTGIGGPHGRRPGRDSLRYTNAEGKRAAIVAGRGVKLADAMLRRLKRWGLIVFE